MKTWQIITLVILCTVSGVLLTLYFKKSGNVDVVKNLEQKIKQHEVTIDSLQIVNRGTVVFYEKKIDSIDGVVINKQRIIVKATNEIVSITKKYQDIRDSIPDFDTTIRYYEVLAGRECIEKMVRKEIQLEAVVSIIGDLNHKIKFITDEKDAIQKQFDKSITVNKVQNQDLIDAKDVLKKEQRKLRWQRIGLITEGVIIVAGAVYIVIKK